MRRLILALVVLASFTAFSAVILNNNPFFRVALGDEALFLDIINDYPELRNELYLIGETYQIGKEHSVSKPEEKLEDLTASWIKRFDRYARTTEGIASKRNPKTDPSIDLVWTGTKNEYIGIGYVRIKVFDEKTTSDEFRQAVNNLDISKGLIIDLRNCPGGRVDSAEKVAGLILGPDKLLGRGKGRDFTTKFISRGEKIVNTPILVVLIDSTTASAAEILAWSLKFHGKAILVGGKTYGKGVGQSAFPSRLVKGTYIWTTTIVVCLEDGTSEGLRYHGKGISPDVEVSRGFRQDAQRTKAFEIILKNN